MPATRYTNNDTRNFVPTAVYRVSYIGKNFVGTKFLRTRTPPIRTLVDVPIIFDIKSEGQFLYQTISGKVAHLTKLGMAQKTIADALSVHPKTVRKGLSWLSTTRE